MVPNTRTELVGAIDKFDKEILAGIGLIIARWGYLQWQLGVLIREVCGLAKDTARVVTVGAEFAPMCGMLRTFTSSDRWITDAVLRNDLDGLVDDIQTASEMRNAYAHGLYGWRADKKHPVRFLVKKSHQRMIPSFEVITLGLLQEVEERARKLQDRAQEITERLKKSPHIRH